MAVDYWTEFVRRRWMILVLVFGVILVLSAVEAAREYGHRPFDSSAQLFVSATPADIQSRASNGNSGYETDAQLMAQDLSAIGASRLVASDIHANLVRQGLGSMSISSIQADISASNSGRLVNLSAVNSSASAANLIGSAQVRALSRDRARFLGPFEAKRSAVRVVGSPVVTRASASHILTSLALRVLLGAVVAIALALAWDYLDDSLHTEADLEARLDAPILARIS